MLPACVGRIPALLNTTSFFPTHAGIFYYAFHFFRHICILQEYFLHIFSEFPTRAGNMFLVHLKSVGHFLFRGGTTQRIVK